MKADSMTHQKLDAEMLLGRVREVNYNANVQTASLIMSGVLALAAIELVEIVKGQDDVAIRLALWLATAATSVFFFRLQLVRLTIVTAQYPVDAVGVFLVTGFQLVLMFALLAPIPGVAQSWKFWLIGFTVLTVFSVVANIRLHSLLTPSRLASLFSEELSGFASVIRTRFEFQWRLGAAYAAFGLGAAALAWWGAATDWIAYVIFAWSAVTVTVSLLMYGRLKQELLENEQIALKALEARAKAAA
jgi:hypothetical protein